MLAMPAYTNTIETIMSTGEQLGVVLYGMMGSGKSELGVRLAEHQNWDFVDTDKLIESAYGMPCRDLVAAGSFVDAQNYTILGFIPDRRSVIATGGSVAMYPELVSHLGQFGVGVFIKPSAAELTRRLTPERIKALNNPKGLPFVELHAERSEHYRRAARYTLEIANGETPERSLSRLIKLVNEW